MPLALSVDILPTRSMCQLWLTSSCINFARQTDVRLVIKNTGHDFSGKSRGAGALSIWTHNLKGIQHVPSYNASGTDWTGAAFKIGAGGEGQTVGVAGGYVLGGGNSPLSSIHGLAADQVLSMEVVLPDGRFVTASFAENTELFSALRGGGGSTFGVVTSVTIKTYPTIPVTASTFTWSTGAKSVITHDNFWAGFRAYPEKREVDPGDVLWAATAVGSEGWRVVADDGLPTENGRLCRV
ncbi:hypothetical protein BDV30DRAFT_240712 [Aspergillus minisclerotigenes]|uniref:FAD-binding PCMH-type domain-containing protein n=1 Tax=Aspergillus minisclerotigenes TaxID=656917 RepID=A0A5N6J0X7_9EURO|nr:hypothetical protein BDV30DRAFT_240712 [Aspergillus minisclerotigenes]